MEGGTGTAQETVARGGGALRKKQRHTHAVLRFTAEPDRKRFTDPPGGPVVFARGMAYDRPRRGPPDAGRTGGEPVGR